MANLKYSELKPIVEEYGGLIMDQVYEKFTQDNQDAKKLENQLQENQRQENDNFNLDDIKKQVSKNQQRKQAQTQFDQLFGEQNDILGADANKGNDDGFCNIENAKRTKFVFKQIQLIDFACNILAFTSICLSVLEYDIRFRQLLDKAIDPILLLLSLNTIVLIIVICIKCWFDLKLMKEQKSLPDSDTIFTSGLYKNLIFEIIIIIIHPCIIFDGNIVKVRNAVTKQDVTYEVNDFLGLIVLLRIYMVIRSLLNFSIFASPRATRLCKMYGCDGGKFFAIKSIMNESPLYVVILYFIMSLFLLGHAIRVCEETYNEAFGYYWNCFWLIIITMTTVGYGDLFPRCLPARIVILVTCIWGASLVSLLVVALTNTFNMDISESKAHNVILRLTERKALHDEAAWVLTSAAKTSFLKKKKNFNPNANIQDKKILADRLGIIKSHAESFRQVSRKIKNMYDVSNLTEEMARYFDYLKDELKTIQENQVLLKDYMLKLKSTKHQNQQNINKNAEFIAKFQQDDTKIDQLIIE